DPPRVLLEGGELVLVHGPGVVQEAADQGRLAVVHAAAGEEAEQVGAVVAAQELGGRQAAGGVLDRHQKYPSRFLSSIEPSRSWSMTRVMRSEWRATI